MKYCAVSSSQKNIELEKENKMMLGDNLTSEKIKGYFKNDFELANQVIRVIRHLVKSGKEFNLDELLLDIAQNPQKYAFEDLEKKTV